jgi:transcriptional regulator with XRE-family HTH domain
MNPDVNSAFAARLRSSREERGISLRKLAEATGLCWVTIQRWEREKNGVTLSNAVLVAKFFGWDLNDFASVL